jgi:hypothetical protein
MPVEAMQVHGAELLNQYARGVAGDLYLRAERRGRGASRRRGYQRRRQPEQRVSLNDDGVAGAALLVTASGGQSDAIDVTPRHEGQSADTASMSAITARRSAVSAGSSTSRRTSSASAERR